jgi:hypothetical protein
VTARHQEVIFDLTGQTFFYDPPELFRPSGTPTVEVFPTGEDDDGTAESATTGAASVDSVNTTLNGAVSIGDTSLTLTSGTGVTKGRRYLLTDADGECELVEIAGISGTSATLRHPIINAYATASTFQGTRISISVDPTWVAAEDNLSDVTDPDSTASYVAGASGYRLRWAYTSGGVATIGVSYADLVRYQSKNLVTALDVDRLFPGWIDRLGPDYRNDQGAALIDEAFHAVKMDALTDAQLLRRIRDTQVLSDLVKHRAKLLAVQNEVLSGRADPAALTVVRDIYDQRYNALIREPKIAVDQSGGGSNGEAVRLPAWRR